MSAATELNPSASWMFSPVLWVAIMAIFLIYVAFYKWRIHKGGGTITIPGPKGLPKSKLGHNGMLKLTREYGPVVAIRAFGQCTVVINTTEVIREVLTSNDFWLRPKRYRSQIVSGNYKSIVSQRDRRIHRDLRRSVHTTLKLYDIDNAEVETLITVKTDELVDRFRQYAVNGTAFNPYQDIYMSMVQIICHIALGVDIGLGDPLITAVKEMEKSILKMMSTSPMYVMFDWFPWLQYIPGFAPAQDAQQAKYCRDRLWSDHIKRLVDTYGTKAGSAYSYLTQLEGQSGDSQTIDEDNTKQSMLDLFFAGTATTSTSLHCLINILIHHPDVQEKMAAEVSHFLFKNKGEGERELGFTSRGDLPYCYAVVLELLRYTTVVPISVPREAVQDAQILGYSIPKGTQIFPNLFAANHDENIWPDPWIFRPKRYLTEDGNVVPPDHPNRKNILTFGAGVRICLGEKLAINRIFLMIAILLRHFQFCVPSQEEMVPCDPRLYKPSTLLSPDPYNVILKLRQGS